MLPDDLDKKCTDIAVRLNSESSDQLWKNIMICFQQHFERCTLVSLSKPI